MKGHVKWFSAVKGIGFIVPEGKASDGANDIFVHYSAIEGEGYRNLQEAEIVEFDCIQTPKGLQAQNVRRVF